MENVSYSYITEQFETFTSISAHNATGSNRITEFMPIFKVIFTLILIIIMFGMGCAVNHRTLLENLRRPVGISVGLSCQIFLMPVLAYVIVKISSMKTIQAIAFMLVGCSPGGGNSNVITYYIDGDMSLSVALTTFSNILALGTIPLYVLIFTALEHIDGNFTIPYSSIAISLAAIGVPIILGILCRYKFPKKTRYIPKVVGGIAVVMLIATVISMLVVTKMPFVFSVNTILPVTILPFLGMGSSYLISSIPIFKLPTRAKKAIAVETLIQNAGLSNSILVLTYGSQISLVGEAITIPLLYNIAQTIIILAIIVGYRLWLCRKSKTSHKETKPQEFADSDEGQPFKSSSEKRNPTDDYEKCDL